MPRAAGESEKLGNRYEGVWIVDSLLDVFGGVAATLNVEPFGDEARGVEFVKALPSGEREFHSAKRQTSANLWSLHELTVPDPRGRSILGDLVAKLHGSPDTRAVFVSGTTANVLYEIWDRAARSQSFAAFAQNLASSGATRRDFEEHLAPLFADAGTAYSALRRMRVVGITEDELLRRVEQRIRQRIYRPDGRTFEPVEVRVLLGELVFPWLGQPIDVDVVRAWLSQHGYAERDWLRDRVVAERVTLRIKSYLHHVEAELIAGGIERTEARDALDALRGTAKRRVVILGCAGLGKSCATAQVVHGLVKKPCAMPARASRRAD